jgi:hypothetical protein
MGGVRGREFYNITGRTQFFPQHKFEKKNKKNHDRGGEMAHWREWRALQNNLLLFLSPCGCCFLKILQTKKVVFFSICSN